MKTNITVRTNHDNTGWDVNVQVIVAGHALLDFTSYDLTDSEDEVREQFRLQIPQYEATAKAKALAIFKELIA